MRHPYYLAFFIFLLASCATMTAPQTVKQRMAYVDSQFTALVDTASDLREAGILTDEYVDEVDALIQSGDASLTAGWVALGKGDQDAVLTALQVTQSITLKLQQILQEMQNE